MNISTRIIKISKYLSYHLPEGWVEIDKLITAAGDRQFPLSYGELKTVIEQNEKQRFMLDRTGKLI